MNVMANIPYGKAELEHPKTVRRLVSKLTYNLQERWRTMFENLNNDSRYFVDNMFSHVFLPLITRSTRFPSGGQHGSPSIILDHVWYNRCNAVWSGILIYDVTDHLPTFIVLKDVLLPNSTLVRVKFRDKSVANIERFIQVCSELNFDLSVTDVNINTKLFIETLDELYCRSFPVKVKYISCKRLSKPWLTSGLLKSIKNKSKYFKQFKLGLINETFYKSYRNSLTNAVKQAKRTYYLNSFEICKGDVKGTWRLLNDLIVREKKNRNVNSVIVDNIEITNSKEIANKFNSYFINIADIIDSNLPNPVSDPIDNINTSLPNSFFILPVTPNEIINTVHSLKKKSYGFHSLSTKMFKLIIQYVCVPLSHIINDSIEQGKFPDILKRATVTPVLKSGSEKDLRNYRPISVLPLLSKVFEKCICNRLISFLSKNNVLSRYQFGFQKKKSTTDALLNYIEYVYRQLNEKSHTVGVALDFSKAFDTVSHDILLRKQLKYGIRGLAFSWFRSYLSGRTQKVRLSDGMCSGA